MKCKAVHVSNFIFVSFHRSKCIWSIARAVFHQLQRFFISTMRESRRRPGSVDGWSEYITEYVTNVRKSFRQIAQQLSDVRNEQNVEKAPNNRSQWLVRALRPFLLLYGVCVCVRGIIIMLFSFFLTFCFIAECVSVLSLAVWFLNSVRAVGKFNQAGGEMKCL